MHSAQPPHDGSYDGSPRSFDVPQSLQSLPNARLVRARLSADVVSAAFGRMPPPCRCVVSGPGEFNSAARAMLAPLVDVDEQVTILSA